MKTRISVYVGVLVLLTVLSTVACTKAPNDAQIVSDIQTKLSTDSGLADKQIAVQAAAGTVTLSGTVDNDAQRDAASRYASAASGVKQVVNNLQIAPAPTPVAEMQPPAPEPEKPSPAPSSSRRAATKVKRSSFQDEPPAKTEAAPPPASTEAVSAPQTAPVAPATPPPPQKVTIPSGTTLAVRLVDTINSETAQQGQTFHATLDSPLAVDGDVVIPAGYDVEGHVVTVQSAGKFAGKSLLTLQLDRISAGGKYYNIQTDQWTKEGSSRGKNTAAKVGAGAAIGAIIGGIAGGGKGAAIGAAAGGGLGGGVQAATKGQQIDLPSETILNFTLQSSVSVIPAKPRNEGRPKMDSNN
jgi:hypothetical protein